MPKAPVASRCLGSLSCYEIGICHKIPFYFYLLLLLGLCVNNCFLTLKALKDATRLGEASTQLGDGCSYFGRSLLQIWV
jgi:hypothetical protein